MDIQKLIDKHVEEKYALYEKQSIELTQFRENCNHKWNHDKFYGTVNNKKELILPYRKECIYCKKIELIYAI